MKKVYVTELTFEDDKVVSEEQVIAEHGSNNWTVKDVAELIQELDYNGFSLDDDRKGLEVTINDFDELANWAITHGLLEYSDKNTTDSAPHSGDFSYQGEPYKLIHLIGDMLWDFLSDAISNLRDIDSFPTGLEIAKREL